MATEKIGLYSGRSAARPTRLTNPRFWPDKRVNERTMHHACARAHAWCTNAHFVAARRSSSSAARTVETCCFSRAPRLPHFSPSTAPLHALRRLQTTRERERLSVEADHETACLPHFQRRTGNGTCMSGTRDKLCRRVMFRGGWRRATNIQRICELAGRHYTTELRACLPACLPPSPHTVCKVCDTYVACGT
jgi:hypothetical protein